MNVACSLNFSKTNIILQHSSLSNMITAVIYLMVISVILLHPIEAAYNINIQKSLPIFFQPGYGLDTHV